MGASVPAARPASTSRFGSGPMRPRPLLRSYSLSGPPGAGYYRIRVKREPTASPAAICMRGSRSATSWTSARHAVRFILDGTTQRCC